MQVSVIFPKLQYLKFLVYAIYKTKEQTLKQITAG